MQAQAPPTEDQLRELIQGPGDVEWKLVFKVIFLSGSQLIALGSYRYEMRRDCQEIIPGLLLGPFQVSKSLETLQSLQITHMFVHLVSWHGVERPDFPYSTVSRTTESVYVM